MLSLLAGLLTVLGLAALFEAWRRSGGRGLTWAGWSALALSLPVWTAAGGPDRGVALGLCALCGLAVGVICLQIMSAAPPRKRTAGIRKNVQITHRSSGAKLRSAIRLFGGILLYGPFCGVLALVIAIGAHQAMLLAGLHPANALVAELFIFPVLWASLAATILIRKGAA